MQTVDVDGSVQVLRSFRQFLPSGSAPVFLGEVFAVQNGVSYTPGQLLAVVASRTVLVVDAPTDWSLAGPLWELALDDAPVDEILDVLVRRGIRTSPSFAIVRVEGEAVRALVRGSVAVCFERTGEPVRLDATGATTWLEGLISGATRVLVGDIEQRTELPYLVDTGVVLVAGLALPTAKALVADPAGARGSGRSAGPVEPDGSGSDPGSAGDGGAADEVGTAAEPVLAPRGEAGGPAGEGSGPGVRPPRVVDLTRSAPRTGSRAVIGSSAALAAGAGTRSEPDVEPAAQAEVAVETIGPEIVVEPEPEVAGSGIAEQAPPLNGHVPAALQGSPAPVVPAPASPAPASPASATPAQGAPNPFAPFEEPADEPAPALGMSESPAESPADEFARAAGPGDLGAGSELAADEVEAVAETLAAPPDERIDEQGDLGELSALADADSPLAESSLLSPSFLNPPALEPPLNPSTLSPTDRGAYAPPPWSLSGGAAAAWGIPELAEPQAEQTDMRSEAAVDESTDARSDERTDERTEQAPAEAGTGQSEETDYRFEPSPSGFERPQAKPAEPQLPEPRFFDPRFIDPPPIDSPPIDSLPIEPLPIEPLPIEPLPIEPLPIEPLPIEPLPSAAGPVDAQPMAEQPYEQLYDLQAGPDDLQVDGDDLLVNGAARGPLPTALPNFDPPSVSLDLRHLRGRTGAPQRGRDEQYRDAQYQDAARRDVRPEPVARGQLSDYDEHTIVTGAGGLLPSRSGDERVEESFEDYVRSRSRDTEDDEPPALPFRVRGQSLRPEHRIPFGGLRSNNGAWPRADQPEADGRPAEAAEQGAEGFFDVAGESPFIPKPGGLNGHAGADESAVEAGNAGPAAEEPESEGLLLPAFFRGARAARSKTVDPVSPDHPAPVWARGNNPLDRGNDRGNDQGDRGNPLDRLDRNPLDRANPLDRQRNSGPAGLRGAGQIGGNLLGQPGIGQHLSDRGAGRDGFTPPGGGAPPPQAPPREPPRLLGVWCDAGHVTSPDQPECRVCGLRVPSQAPILVARPPLGVLIFDNGDRVEVDRPVVLGRDPKPVSSPDPEPPVLHAVQSRTGQVSRTHAEIRASGWDVVLTDLDAMNGTTITSPGGAAVAIEPGVPTVITSGSRADLGGEAGFVFEVEA